MALKTHDVNEVSVVVNGVPIFGFVEDTSITIESEDQKYTDTTDIHGNVTRYKATKKPDTVKFFLTDTTPSNDVFSSYVELDEASNAGVFSIMVKDGNGNSLFTSPSAWVRDQATDDYGRESKTREWTIRAANAARFTGGITE